jgi:hypothetical protein
MLAEHSRESIAAEFTSEQAKDRIVQLFPKVARENIGPAELQLWTIIERTIKAIQTTCDSSGHEAGIQWEEVRNVIRPDVTPMLELLSSGRLDREFRHEMATVVQNLMSYPDIGDEALERMVPRFIKKFSL